MLPVLWRIAEAAHCARSTVHEAISALEAAGLLAWVNRLKRFREWAPGLPGIGSSAAASVAVTTRRRPSRPTRMSGVSGGGAASPIISLNLSVPRVGRKTGMTLFIARLQFEIRALARPAADELDEPPRTPHARQGQRRRGQDGDPPPRRGCRCPRSVASVWRRQRRSATPRLLEPLAASWSGRRDAGIGRRATSATTAPNPT